MDLGAGGGRGLRAGGLGVSARRGTREVEKPKEFDKSFLTYKGFRWPREMFQFIVLEIGVPRDKLAHVAEASQCAPHSQKSLFIVPLYSTY
jgi:hypothetical protein